MRNTLFKLIGWKALILHGDPCVYDRWRWIKRYLLPGPLQTLDAGCGNGVFTIYASMIGNESMGISFEEQKNRTAKLRADILGIGNIQFIQGDLRKLDEMSEQLGKFDQIICLEIAEHILDDEKFIAGLSGLLKPSGRLLFTAPYKYSKRLFGLKLSKDEDGGHVRWGYTHSEIRDMFNKCGLDIQVEGYISGFVSQQLANLMLILHRQIGKYASWIITLPLRLLQVLDLPITRFTGYPYLCIGVVGVKKR